MQQEHACQEPQICGISVVAQDIVLLTAQQGAVEGGTQVPYEAQPGEHLEADSNTPDLVYIVKDGQRVGVKVEDRQLGTRRLPFERLVGKELNVVAADDPQSYRVNGVCPVKVFRKTKPNNFADPAGGYALKHQIYLVSDTPFSPKGSIEIVARPGIFDREREKVHFVPERLRSEAIQVNQLGYRPDDPGKKAYLSQWMGLGGAVNYDSIRAFYLLNEKDERVFQGAPKLNHTGDIVPIGKEEISSLCPVYELDFSDFTQEGTFRVVIPELGCSFPFPIDCEKTWLHGFRKSMNALYCQRSGIVTGKPYTEFERPRCYHPDDGQVVYQSNCSLFESGNGMNCYGTDVNNFGNLVRKATDQVVENAWGGYFDACDWDRRIQHLKASKLQMELFLMFPEFYTKLRLHIPESGNGIPDILNEAMYNIDFYKRLQLPDGGIRGGIEQEEHPILGQCGWQDTLKAYAYAPDCWSSYYDASAAARMAHILSGINPSLQEEYCQSAEKAFQYAEKTYAEGLEKEGHKWTRRTRAAAKQERENAACDLFRLTADSRYGNVFVEIWDDRNYDAAFAYCTLPDGMGDEQAKHKCKQAIFRRRGASAGQWRKTALQADERRTRSSFVPIT